MSAAETGTHPTPWRRDRNTVYDAHGRMVLACGHPEWLMERVVAAVNADAVNANMIGKLESAPLSDSALARLEQTWRENAASDMHHVKSCEAGGAIHNANTHRARASLTIRHADELAALRARGETRCETCAYFSVLMDGDKPSATLKHCRFMRCYIPIELESCSRWASRPQGETK